MSRIHYFQRYATRENTITNNTLQLLGRIYSYSPQKASQFLTDLTGEPIEIGIEINQQRRSEGSVPDGQVIQRSFKVLIEAKVDTPLDTDQLIRHSSTFSGEDQKILLLLTKKPLEAHEQDKIKDQITGIIFSSITYAEICESAKRLFKEYEDEMCALVYDYEEYCNDTGLFDQSGQLMRMVPCRISLEINKQYGIYFHPSDRSYTTHRFVGLYKDKAVHAILEIDSIFDVECRNGHLKKELIAGRKTDEYDRMLCGMISDAKSQLNWNVELGHRFFCGETIETNFVKATSGGMQGHRFINLREIIGNDFDNVSVKEIANRLREKQWE